MGWDLHALRGGRYLEKDRDREVLAEFERVAERLDREYGVVDAFFAHGWLHLSGCKRALVAATGEKVDGEVWSAEKVRAVYEAATWVEPEDPNERGYFWNVRLMLETCRRLGLGLELNL